MLIGIWVYDELSFNKYHQNYNCIAQVMQNQTWEGEVYSDASLPLPAAPEIRTKFSSDFKYVAMSTFPAEHILAYGEKKFSQKGNFVEPDFPEIFTFKMIKGTRSGLKDPASILLSESVAQTLFGDADPINKIVKFDNKVSVKVAGVFEDLPKNTGLAEVSFLLPWDLYLSLESWLKNQND